MHIVGKTMKQHCYVYVSYLAQHSDKIPNRNQSETFYDFPKLTPTWHMSLWGTIPWQTATPNVEEEALHTPAVMVTSLA